MKVWCLLCTGEGGTDVCVYTTHELAMQAFIGWIGEWDPDEWTPATLYRHDGSPTGDRLEVCRWFEERGYYWYDDALEYRLTEETLQDGTES